MTFERSYWIIGLAVVGHPSRNYLWILSRTSRLEEVVYQNLLQRIAVHGYAVDRILRTPQP